ncbi:MAG: DEAD/DEAH box helicase [Reinekea sp.]
MFQSFHLHPKLLSAIDKLGWSQPTDVQAATLEKALDGIDLVIQAETGSGKTAAYLLPALHRLLSETKPKGGIRMLVMVPTRELAQQVKNDCDGLAVNTGLKSAVIRGGQEFQYQASLLRRNPDIIIATPGRLTEHLNKNSTDLYDVECLVLDECDRMLDMGFRDEVLAIAAECRNGHQSILLSATLKHKGVANVAKDLLKDVEFVQVKPEILQQNIRQQIIYSDGPAHKEKLVNWLLDNETFQKAIIFTKTRVQTDELGKVLRFHQRKVATLHGEVAQDARNNIMAKFREGALDVIVATDVAARGLDIDGVDLVINFDMAHSGDEHVHRVGRTGRAGQSGLAINLIAAHDYNLMNSIERYLKIRFERRLIDPLKAKYTGPKNVKSNGKPVGKKKPKKNDKKAVHKKPHKPVRKSRSHVKIDSQVEDGGFAPLKKKRPSSPSEG